MSLAALLARKLCHDFAGPAGAIGTAVEMLADGSDPELLALTADSSAALTAALELYRYILTPSAEPIEGGRARALVAGWLVARGDLALDWPDDGELWPPGVAALTAGLAMVAAEAARSGTLIVMRGSAGVAGAPLPSDVEAALAGTPPVTTRAALAAVLAEEAARLGGTISVNGDRLTYKSRRRSDG